MKRTRKPLFWTHVLAALVLFAGGGDAYFGTDPADEPSATYTYEIAALSASPDTLLPYVPTVERIEGIQDLLRQEVPFGDPAWAAAL